MWDLRAYHVVGNPCSTTNFHVNDQRQCPFGLQVLEVRHINANILRNVMRVSLLARLHIICQFGYYTKPLLGLVPACVDMANPQVWDLMMCCCVIVAVAKAADSILRPLSFGNCSCPTLSAATSLPRKIPFELRLCNC